MRSSLFRRLLPYATLIAAMAAWRCGFDPTPAGIAGWTLLTLLLSSTVAIICASAAPRRAARAWLVLSSAAAACLIAALAPRVGILAAIAEAMLAATWCGIWCATAWALRRWGPGCSAGVSLFLASACMALPVAAMPLVRAAARWGPPGNAAWQNSLVQIIAHACPSFPALSALRPSVKIDWGTLPGMYAWSGLGQEIPLALPNPWLCATLYAGAAGLMILLGRLLGPARTPTPAKAA